MDIAPGTVAFITGGAQGIGLGIARAFAGEGLPLALADRDADALAAAKQELSERTPVVTFTVDVSDRAAMASAADEAERLLGPVSVLVNNAGVGLGVMMTDIAQEITFGMWDHVMGVNLDGVNNGVTTFVPRMIERGTPGHVVNTASAAGLVVFAERSSGYTYHASKFAVVGLTEALDRGLKDGSYPIGASVLIPGMVATDVGANSLRSAPESVVPATAAPRMAEIAHAGGAALAAYGRDIDSVGRMVLDGVRHDRLYIPTDRLAAKALTQRTEAIVASMPEEHATHDDALGSAMRDRR